MIFLPIIFGLIFMLTLTLKLLGGQIAWWIVITFGALFFVPLLILLVLVVMSRLRK